MPGRPGNGWQGVYFRNFSKRTYIFEILIFFKYKKEKIAAQKSTQIDPQQEMQRAGLKLHVWPRKWREAVQRGSRGLR